MFKYSLFFSLSILFFAACIPERQKLPAEYVDPFIGTGAHGHTFPGAAFPFGMIQLSPDNGRNGWDWCSGYHYSDSIIAGFSHLHLSGTGIGDLCDISLLPIPGKIKIDRETPNREFVKKFYTGFSHENENASPGYYGVKLDNQVEVDLTVSERMGIHRIKFPEQTHYGVMLDLGFAINWDKTTDCYIEAEGMNTLLGYRYSKGWAADQKVFFAIRFSFPYSNLVIKTDEQLHYNPSDRVQAADLVAFVSYSSHIDTLLIKVALSSASIEGALAELDQGGGWDFDVWKQESEHAWNKHLGSIRATSSNPDILTNFYTALYHAQIAPSLFSDHYNEFHYDSGKVQHADDFKMYSTFSLWDTYRALHPLLTILEPELCNDFIRSFLAHYDKTGLLPVWTLHGNETNCMIGYHSIPVIVDAFKKGIRNFDHAKAYQAMKHSATQKEFGINHYQDFGYIPYELENESVSKTLEYAFDDWCIAQMAKELGNDSDYVYFSKRASAFEHLFDPETGFMRGKDQAGNWKADFNPLYANHRDDEYTEGNAWQYSWYVPHNVERLIELMGGNEAFVHKLDQLFEHPEQVAGKHASPDISGLIGQYAHGNEPSHHIAYLYNYADRPDKTQAMVRRIMSELYKPTPDGLCGNEDCGQMSAWYIFSAMGFYPVNPASGIYQLGSPILDGYEIDLPGEKVFKAEVVNQSPDNIFVKEVSLNGEKLDRHWISHSEIMQGGTIRFVMTGKE